MRDRFRSDGKRSCGEAQECQRVHQDAQYDRRGRADRGKGLQARHAWEGSAEDNQTATFLFHHFLSDRDLEWLRGLDAIDPDEDAALALVYVREMGSIDNAKLRDLTGLDTLAASKCLTHLRDANLLEMCGGGSATYYKPGSALADEHGASREEVVQLELGASEAQGSDSQTQGSSDKTQGSEHQTQGSEDKTQGSESESETADMLTALRNEVPRHILEQIDQLGKRVAPDTMRALILDLCRLRYMRPVELAHLLDRRSDYVTRKFLAPLVDEARLERKHPETPGHPKQAYRAVGDDDE